MIGRKLIVEGLEQRCLLSAASGEFYGGIGRILRRQREGRRSKRRSQNEL